MGKEIIGAEVKVEYGQVGNLRKELRQATQDVQALSAKFGDTSKEAIMAAQKVAKLKDAIGDAKSLAYAFNPDRKFAAVGQAINGITGGFASLQGAIGLMGVKSEEVEKQLLKVQSALALTQGLDNVRESIQGFKNLSAVVGNTLVKAFSTLKGAIISTGIGALVVAVGVLIANFDKLKAVIDGVSTKQRGLAESSKKSADEEQRKLDIVGDQDNILKLQGKTEKEILKIKIAQTDEVINQREQQLKASQELLKQQVAGTQRNRDLLASFINFISKPLQFALSTANKIANLFGKGVSKEMLNEAINETSKQMAEYIFDPKETLAEGEKGLKELEAGLIKLRNDRAGLLIAFKEAGPKDKKGKTKEEIEKERIAQLERDIQALRDRNKAQQDYYNEQERMAAEAEKKEEERAKRDIDRQNKGLANQVAAFEYIRKNKEEQLAYDRFIEGEKQKAYYNTANALTAVADLIGRQTAAGKVLATAAALINTFLGATEVIRAKSVLPEPLGTISKIASVTAIIATGLSAVKNINKVSVPGYGGGGGGSVPSFSAAPLQAALSPQAQSNALNSQAINNLASTPSRAYILNRDIQNNGQINNYLQRNSSIG